MQSFWPFRDPPRTVTITTRQVMELGFPILLVTHDADDGCWQMLCGTTNESDDARLVALEQMYNHDVTLGQLADLPCGWRAWRNTVTMPWIRERGE